MRVEAHVNHCWRPIPEADPSVWMTSQCTPRESVLVFQLAEPTTSTTQGQAVSPPSPQLHPQPELEPEFEPVPHPGRDPVVDMETNAEAVATGSEETGAASERSTPRPPQPHAIPKGSVSCAVGPGGAQQHPVPPPVPPPVRPQTSVGTGGRHGNDVWSRHALHGTSGGRRTYSQARSWYARHYLAPPRDTASDTNRPVVINSAGALSHRPQVHLLESRRVFRGTFGRQSRFSRMLPPDLWLTKT